MFETPKQTEKIVFLFRETDWKATETDLVSVLLVQTENTFCFFRGHPILGECVAEKNGTKSSRFHPEKSTLQSRKKNSAHRE
jgi:hypothetical protein